MAQPTTLQSEYPITIEDIDYTDCFESKPIYGAPPALRDLVYFFITKWPKWVNVLLVIRTVIVLPFGLKTGSIKVLFNPHKPLFNWRNKGRIEIFTIVHLSENVVVLYMDDKHLDAYLIFERVSDENKTKLKLQTDVHFHNSLGWWYFSLIKPFHKLIVKQQLKITIKSFRHV